jgi:cytochrome b subunit of formate dehydrogenase
MADSKPKSDGKLPDAGRRIGWLGRWQSLPLYWRILMAMVLGLVCGLVLQERAAFLEIPSKIILQLLGALAPPLILVAVTHVLMTSEITGRMAAGWSAAVEHDRGDRHWAGGREHDPTWQDCRC